MLTIFYQGFYENNNFFPYNSPFKGTKTVEGFLRPNRDEEIPIYTNWDQEQITIQSIVFDTYTINFDIRDSEYQDFQQIRYASTIKISEGSKSFDVEIVEFEAEKKLNEFWNIYILFKDIGRKRTRNIILEKAPVDYFRIYDSSATSYSLEQNLYLDVLKSKEFTKNDIEAIDKKIVNCNLLKDAYKYRIFVTFDDLATLLSEINEVGETSDKYISVFTSESTKPEECTEYTLNIQDIGRELYQVDIVAYINQEISTP